MKKIQTSKDKLWVDESGMKIPYSRITKTERLIERNVAQIVKKHTKMRDSLIAYKEELAERIEKCYQADMKSKDVDPSDKKGGYTMYCFNRSVKVERAVHGNPSYDEATIEAAKIKFDQYLEENVTGAEDFVKDMIIDAFESRNGQLDKNRINKLISYKNRSKNKLFISACDLLSTAVRYPSSSIYYSVYTMDSNGKYENLVFTIFSIMSHSEKQLAADQAASIKYHSITMPEVTITQPQDDQYLVNGKLLYLDSNNKWITTEELTYNERKAFRKELQRVKNG